MKSILSKIARKTIGAYLLIVLTILLLPVLLFTNDIEIYKTAVEYISKD